MTEKWMLRALVDLGFRERDAEVYLFLGLNGSQKASVIAEALGTNKQQVYRTLRRLQNLRIVSGTQKHPEHFMALSFGKTMDLLARDRLQKARRIEQNKDRILALWDSCVKRGNKS